MGSKERVQDIVRVARFAAKFGYLFGEELAKLTVLPLGERLFPQPQDANPQVTTAEHAAHVGIQTVRYGRKRRQPEVELMGAAMAVKAAVRAEADEAVPTETVEAIVMDIVEADIDPALNPLVREEDAVVIDKLIYQEEISPPTIVSATPEE